MEGIGLGDELIAHGALLLIGDQIAILLGHLLFELQKLRIHPVGRCFTRGLIMKGNFVQLAAHKTAFDLARFQPGDDAVAGFNLEHAQHGLLGRQGNSYVKGVSMRPLNQFFRRVAPLQAHRRAQRGLRQRNLTAGDGCKDQGTKASSHGNATFMKSHPFRKSRSRRGSALIEATLALAILVMLGLILLKLAMNILLPRQWTLQQGMADAYLTIERAEAQRIPFNELLAGNRWPDFNNGGVQAVDVQIGLMPGGKPVAGRVTRTRELANEPDNPAGLETWKVHSVLTYQIGSRTYTKSRTVVRTQ